ncbi:MAG: NF038129 family PEP-CTERM protein [Rhodospirillales bacterium]|nr:NF038129 family PEP-CTERM protein [Acetobacter sp.]
MMKVPKASRLRYAALLSGSLLLAGAAHSQANLSYNVYLNTASLVGNSNGPFSLDVVLGSGSQTPNSDNTVTLSNFVFVNGSLGTISFTSGGVTGTMASTVTLTNSSEDNEFAETFSNTVTQIQFSVNMTSNTNNPFPDQFNVLILDGGLNNIPTTDPNGGNTLVLANINTGQTLASVQTYQSTATGEAPGVTAAVPEPGTVASMLAGLGALGVYLRGRKSRGARCGQIG